MEYAKEIHDKGPIVLESRYSSLETIYSTASSSIVRAVRAADKASVVVKIKTGKRDDIIIEACIMQTKLTKHEHILRAFACFDLPDGRLAIETESCMCSMETYLTTLPFNKLPLPHIKSTANQLLRALAYCHRQLVIHCDVKLANIFMTANGCLKLADFGVSVILQSRQDQLSPCSEVNPIGYRPPEILRMQSFGTPVDVWAAACVLLTLIDPILLPINKDIHTQVYFADTVHANIEEIFINAPASMLHICKQMLHPDPSCRPTAFSASLHPFCLSYF